MIDPFTEPTLRPAGLAVTVTVPGVEPDVADRLSQEGLALAVQPSALPEVFVTFNTWVARVPPTVPRKLRLPGEILKAGLLAAVSVSVTGTVRLELEPFAMTIDAV